MIKTSYPAVFHFENNEYWVEFPDLEGCFTSGKTIEEAFLYAQDALGLYLDQNMDSYERTIIDPSTVVNVMSKYPGEIVMLVQFDSLQYAKLNKSKAVKKTLSIPEWLNEEALKENVNFSSVLQEALMDKLNLK